MSVQENKEQLLAEFSDLPNWEAKYKKIIDMGKNLSAPENIMQEKYIVKGCQSQVWLHATHDGDKVHFQGTSDAMIVKGLLALLLKIFSGQKIDDVLQADINFINELGLNVHLSQSRSNGLAAMIKQMKLYAMAFKTIQLQKEQE
tara:strand:- start:4987 stop:5421 length:435 start_codon:yes stop_codon:yes gene_type:complete